jgi:hypothetical protein
MHALIVLLLLGADGGVPAPGKYYVLRVTAQKGGRLTQNGVSTARWSAHCEPLVLEQERVTFGEFTLSIAKDGSLRSPRFVSVRRPSIVIDGWCRAALPDTGLFPDERSCRESVKDPSFIETCDGGACEWNQRPWLLEGCEAELARLRARGSYELSVKHDDALKTLERFMKLVKSGGTMWSMGNCVPFRFTPRDREGRSKLSEAADGGTYEAEAYLEPLFGQASYSFEGGSSEHSGWANTMSRVRLFMGDELVILGERVLVFERSKCAP